MVVDFMVAVPDWPRKPPPFPVVAASSQTNPHPLVEWNLWNQPPFVFKGGQPMEVTMSFDRGAPDASDLVTTADVANVIAPTAIEKAIEVYKLFQHRDESALNQARKVLTSHVHRLIEKGERDERRLTRSKSEGDAESNSKQMIWLIGGNDAEASMYSGSTVPFLEQLTFIFESGTGHT